MSTVHLTTPVEYREIPELPGYRFGADGSVLTSRQIGGGEGPWRFPPTEQQGRKRISIRTAGKQYHYPLGHLIALAFHGPCPEGKRACYRDGNSQNVTADNVYWGLGREVLAEGLKRCRACRLVKPTDDFATLNGYYRDGLNPRCKECINAYQREYAARPQNRNRVAGYVKRNKLKSRYGLTEADLARMTADQRGVCAICGKPPTGGPRSRRLVVDHWHGEPPAGKPSIRSLLCSGCNTGLGAFGDSVAGLMRAVEYLRRHGG